jgi:para-aminobenzoate synthetase/4-amino-4-deoxychorismate lyase
MTIRFDFHNQTLIFDNPVEIIQTDNCHEVLDKLAEVELRVASGLYAAGYISYEAAAAFQPHYLTSPQGSMPLLWFALYSSPSADDQSMEQARQSQYALAA